MSPRNYRPSSCPGAMTHKRRTNHTSNSEMQLRKNRQATRDRHVQNLLSTDAYLDSQCRGQLSQRCVNDNRVRIRGNRHSRSHRVPQWQTEA